MADRTTPGVKSSYMGNTFSMYGNGTYISVSTPNYNAVGQQFANEAIDDTNKANIQNKNVSLMDGVTATLAFTQDAARQNQIVDIVQNLANYHYAVELGKQLSKGGTEKYNDTLDNLKSPAGVEEVTNIDNQVDDVSKQIAAPLLRLMAR